MWVSYLTVFSSLVLAVTHSQIFENVIEIKSIFEKKCRKNADEETIGNVTNALENLNDCVPFHVPPERLDKQQLKEKCIEHSREAYGCFENFVKLAERCLESTESYLPQFLLHAFANISSYQCKHSEVLSVEELLKTNTVKCISFFLDNPDVDPRNNCYLKHLAEANHTEPHIILSKDLCSDLMGQQSCFENKFNEWCPDAPEAKEFYINQIKIAIDVCLQA